MMQLNKKFYEGQTSNDKHEVVILLIEFFINRKGIYIVPVMKLQFITILS